MDHWELSVGLLREHHVCDARIGEYRRYITPIHTHARTLKGILPMIYCTVCQEYTVPC